MTAPHRPLRRTWWPWLPLVAVVLIGLVVGALGSTGPSSNDDRIFAIAKQIKCPVCAGETVAESNVESSQIIRDEIARQVEQGRTDEQILTSIDRSFPDKALLLTPPASGLSGIVWVLPVAALVLALVGLAIAFRRWHEPAGERADDTDRALVAEALSHLDEGAPTRP